MSRNGIAGVVGHARINCRWASNTGGLKSGVEYTLLPAKDPVYGIVVFVVPGRPGTSSVKTGVTVDASRGLAGKIASSGRRAAKSKIIDVPILGPEPVFPSARGTGGKIASPKVSSSGGIAGKIASNDPSERGSRLRSSSKVQDGIDRRTEAGSSDQQQAYPWNQYAASEFRSRKPGGSSAAGRNAGEVRLRTATLHASCERCRARSSNLSYSPVQRR